MKANQLLEKMNEAQGLQQELRSIRVWLDRLAIRTGGQVKIDGGSTGDPMANRGLMTRYAVIGRDHGSIDKAIKSKDFTVVVYANDARPSRTPFLSTYYVATGPDYFSDYRAKDAQTVVSELVSMADVD